MEAVVLFSTQKKEVFYFFLGGETQFTSFLSYLVQEKVKFKVQTF